MHIHILKVKKNIALLGGKLHSLFTVILKSGKKNTMYLWKLLQDL